MFTAPAGSTPTPDIVRGALEYNETQIPRYTMLANYYAGMHDILAREKKGSLKNNKVIINHAKYITDVNVGYFIGNPVEYQPTEEGVNIDLVLEEYKKQTMSNEDHDVAHMASIFGRAGELTYALEDNSNRSKTVDPRNYMIVHDDTMEHNVLFGITYKTVRNGVSNSFKDIKIYTATEVQYWNDKIEIVTLVEPHTFGKVPLIEFINNSEKKGDFESVLSLINAYNVIQSDRVNDREQLVEAILVLYGITMTKEQKQDLREERVLSIPTSQVDGAKAEYLIKQINETEADVLREKIEADIHKISMTPNLSDENFVGNASGVAIRYKLIAFEQSIINKERNFENALKERFKLYANYQNTLNNSGDVEVWQIDVVFNRNLPSNDFETAQMISALRGIVDDETLVSQLSFVDDAAASIAEAQQEATDRAMALSQEFGMPEPTVATKDTAK